jgi:hypothetical protein
MRLPSRYFPLVNRVLRPLGYRIVLSSNGLLFARDSLERAIYELCTRADEGGLESLPDRQRTVVLAWGARGIIGNGGFRYFFEGAWHMTAVADAFRILGFAEAADACEKSLEIFPDHTPPQDAKRRRAILSDTNFKPYAPYEKIVYRIEFDALRSAIGEYIQQHAADFVSVLP